MRRILASVAAVAALSCGPEPGAPGGDPDATPAADGGALPRVSGRVWAPGNAPHQAAPGEAIPIAGALVYLSPSAPPPLPEGVYCDLCEGVEGAVVSDAQGSFSLNGFAPGTQFLVIEKAQFRKVQAITVAADEVIELPAEATTLPSRTDPAAGEWVPRIALAEGLWDNLEEVLGKMAIGAVYDDGVFMGASSVGAFDIWVNGAGDLEAWKQGDFTDLVDDLELMKQYHVILVPCSNGDNMRLFNETRIRDNIRAYVAAGGKFFVTDWSAEWEDAVWPDFITFADHDTSSLVPGFGSGDGVAGMPSRFGAAVDPALREWLEAQEGPLWNPHLVDFTSGLIDADNFGIEGNYARIISTPNIYLGNDAQGQPVYEQAWTWVADAAHSEQYPMTVTFEPNGCGRVLYSSYHTAHEVHRGLLPQERILLYLLMEIGTCKSTPLIE